jgi:hypothetical protein
MATERQKNLARYLYNLSLVVFAGGVLTPIASEGLGLAGWGIAALSFLISIGLAIWAYSIDERKE